MAQLRSELFKLRTTRTTLILALGMVAIVLAATLGQGLATDASDLGRESTQRGFFATGGLGLIFAALVGIMAVTGEFRHGTIRPTLVFSPRRERVLAAKVAVAAAAGLVLTATAETLVLGIGYATFRSRGIDVVLSGSEIGAIAGGTLAAGALWGGIGAGFGAVVRNQVGAIIGLLAWMFIAEGLLFGLTPSYGRYAPGPASNALSGESTEHLLSAAAGGVLLAGYLAAFAALGALSMLRRDVP
jgi:ABC-type transport system involved in multi-copper enzyme maturation permease subunit